MWTWTALDADTKLIVSYYVGDRSGKSAMCLMDDLQGRLANRVQLTTGGHKAYLEAVEGAFVGDGWDQDAREDMFPSRVAIYNDNRLLGTSATTAQSNFDRQHPLYRQIGDLARLRQAHPALRRGRQVVRNYSDTPGLFAVSRIDDTSGQEVLVLFNTSTKPLSAHVELDPVATTLTPLAGSCPASVRAPGSAAITLGALDFVLCAVK